VTPNNRRKKIIDYEIITMPAKVTSRTGIGFWPIPKLGPRSTIPADICQEMIDATLEAIRKALASGVQAYNVGSRGLTRISLADLLKALEFWEKQLELAEGGSSIIAKRVIPTDY
jgi:hypothetical protein